MLQLYNQKPISIFISDRKNKVAVKFCNVAMKMKLCQFKMFNEYLLLKAEKIEAETTSVNLMLVKDNLNIAISLNHFLQLSHAVQKVVANIQGEQILKQ